MPIIIKVYVTFVPFATLTKIDLNKQGKQSLPVHKDSMH